MARTKMPEDRMLVDLYLARDENAIAGTANKYGHALTSLSERITEDAGDAEECVNDTYLNAWNRIPPHRPYEYLFAFLARITRHLSLDRIRYRNRQRREGIVVELSAELEAIIPSPDDSPTLWGDDHFAEVLNIFLETEKPLARRIFLRRYWYMESVEQIASRYGVTKGSVKSNLFRSRERFRSILEREGLWQ